MQQNRDQANQLLLSIPLGGLEETGWLDERIWGCSWDSWISAMQKQHFLTPTFARAALVPTHIVTKPHLIKLIA